MSKISRKLDEKVRLQAKNRCGYCLLPQNLNPTLLEIEHIRPLADGGTKEEENLWLACRECNSHKSRKIRGFDQKTGRYILIFNPRKQNWKRHFEFNEDKTEIRGKSACGRATIEELKLSSDILVSVTKLWVEFDLYPPKD